MHGKIRVTRRALPPLAESIASDPRVSEKHLSDKGFANVRRIGQGVYATISDFSKGLEAVSNGGFIIGRDAALIIEAHRTPAGAALELEALRSVTQVPVRAAIDTHFHYDHAMGNVFYGAQGIPIWAHARTGPLMVERYAHVQGKDKTSFYEPLNNRLRTAATASEQQRAQTDINAYKLQFDTIDSFAITLPTHPLEPAELPQSVDLGGIRAEIETYPGHTPGDIVIRVPEQKYRFYWRPLIQQLLPGDLRCQYEPVEYHTREIC